MGRPDWRGGPQRGRAHLRLGGVRLLRGECRASPSSWRASRLRRHALWIALVRLRQAEQLLDGADGLGRGLPACF
eukprot:3320593-Pyramimonas_sp.AAC.1